MAPRNQITLTEKERERQLAITRSDKTNAPKSVHAGAPLLCDTGPHREDES